MYARDFALIATPIGMVRVSGTVSSVESIAIEPGDRDSVAGKATAVIAAAAQLGEWFAGTRNSFDLPLSPAATPRGNMLRQAMIGIPFGETMSYGDLSRSIGSSARAIGQVCARNPFPIIVPCHRVLNADGGLGAYSAGDGPATKSWLLDHERRYAGKTLL
ncbi:methylated-DNA--[protein]-cysteine S-methyltransferase [Sphingomonas alpina]|uniref:Methylated-DNA--[protein]-cysteine S-methyltransferase n=1 Tax=Sphingomonas alpina TaxID=653931 RepID=A0A7H0LR48_9SPHN|nr:methylated-DNA--[protein]-cysteine S-methyltransferase [Sphingomonas alpina]QNQ12151.1 methylated-DNA--[protein]-cysteine S-methyltransferase [Sphingomonas alpina]